MKNLFRFLPQAVAVAAMALSMSSCQRGQYAQLPKTTPYHATYSAAKSGTAASAVTPETAPAVAPTAEAAQEKIVAAAPAVAKKSTNKTSVSAAAPVTAEKAAPVTPKTAETAAAPAPRKLNLVQKLAVAKVLKQVDKASSKTHVKKHSEAASASKLTGKLRQGVILLIVGLLLELLGIATGLGIIYVLGAIIAIIGLVLIVLYLLDEV